MSADEMKMVAVACKNRGLTIKGWIEDEENDNRPTANLGRALVLNDDEERGLYEGSEGKLTATAVGAEKHGNLQVKFYFTEDETDCGTEVHPTFDLELI